MNVIENNSGLFSFVDLSKDVPSSPRYGDQKFLSYYSFLSLLRKKEFWRQIEALAKTDDLRMTLQGFDVLRGHGLLGLVLLCQYIFKKYRSIPTVEFPEDSRRLHCPAQLRFLDFCFSPACPFDVTSNVSTETQNILDEIKVVQFPLGFSRVDGRTIEALIKRLQEAVTLGGSIAYDMGWGPTDVGYYAGVIGFIIAETIRNVVMHSAAEPNEGYGYLMVEKTRRALTLSVGDIGVGIRRSLASRGVSTQNDVHAIESALLYREKDFACEADLTGLFGLARNIMVVGGEILIRSDSTAVRLRADGSFPPTRDQVVNWIKNPASSQTNLHFGFPGTQIIVEIKGEKRQ